MRFLSWLVGLALLVLLGMAALTYGPALFSRDENSDVWVANPSSAPEPRPTPAAVAPPEPPKAAPPEPTPLDEQVAEDAAAVGMTTPEPDETPQ